MSFFHGGHRAGPYFEGWYFKHQGPQGGVALIVSLHVDQAGQRSACLQVITEEASAAVAFPAKAFSAETHTLQIKLGQCSFSDRGIRLCLDQDGLVLSGALQYGPMTPLDYDIMGPFQYVPGLQCRHGVISMGHRLSGTLSVNGRSYDFTGGAGYIECDRGCAFPDSYLWTQCLWRTHRSNSLMLSVADIPFLGGRFTGCICSILYEGHAYRLATYLGASVLRCTQREAIVCQGPYRLDVILLKASPRPLQAPHGGVMARTIHESLFSTVRYRFWKGNQLLFDHTDQRASFEGVPGRAATPCLME